MSNVQDQPPLPSVHLTFDIDWAPDWAISEVLQLLSEANAPASFFVTHESPVIKEIYAQGHNVGIHPNFLPGTTQGSNWMETVDSLLRLCPTANSMRTHGLVQATPLLQQISRSFPQLQYDLSLFTPNLRSCGLIPWRLESESLTRINYHWEDDICFYVPAHDWHDPGLCGPTTVYDYHPIHIYLNSTDGSEYAATKALLGPRPIHEATREELVPLATTNTAGARTHLAMILKSDIRILSFEELVCELE